MWYVVLAVLVYLGIGFIALAIRARRQPSGWPDWDWSGVGSLIGWPITLLIGWLFRPPVPTDNPTPSSYQNMCNRIGIAQGELRPYGRILIDGRTFEAKAEHGVLADGQAVIVIETVGPLLHVRAVQSP